MRLSAYPVSLLFAGLLAGLLAGCGLGPTGAPTPDAGTAIQGKVIGGQQVIAGAHVYLFAANTTGYGGAGIAASTNNSSISLLTSGTGTTLDSSGGPTNGDYYVTTDSSGLFTITGVYSCAMGQQVYLYSVGGNPGSGTNSAAGLLEVLGNCPGGSSAFAAEDPNIVINEVTTIAAAYSFAGFATDPTHVSSSGTALALTGISNAFANAASLAGIVNGNSLTTTAAGNGSVPQATINTLANIIAACVNSTGPNSSACSTLFSDELSGGSTGTAATDTAGAAIYMAHNPAVNIAALYALSLPTPPFGPALISQPNDFTLSITYSGGGLSSPNGIAIDRAGNAWITNYTGNTVTQLSPLGAVLSPAGGYTGGGLFQPIAIAIDNSGNAWIADDPNSTSSGEVTRISSGSSPTINGYTAGGLMGPYGIAIDATGDVWVPNGDNSSVTKLTSSGTAAGSSPFTGGGLDGPGAVAIDGSGNVWLANHTAVSEFTNLGSPVSGASGLPSGGLSSTLTITVDGLGNLWVPTGSGVAKLSHSGSLLSGSSGYSGGSMAIPTNASIDGSNNVWVANYIGSYPTLTAVNIIELSSSGTILSGANGYGYASLNQFQQNATNVIAVDGSGDVWFADNGTNNTVTEVIGSATPVITPICAGLPATPTSDGSSNLGTRP